MWERHDEKKPNQTRPRCTSYDGGTGSQYHHLQEWLDREETVSHLLFCKGKEEGIDKSYKSFKNCTFQNQTFSECKFRYSQLTDVRFENCDLSNISFAESSLYRVEFISCKLLGTNLSETTMNHVLLHDCNAGYINLAMSKMNQVRFAHSQLRNGTLNDCRFHLSLLTVATL